MSARHVCGAQALRRHARKSDFSDLPALLTDAEQRLPLLLVLHQQSQLAHVLAYLPPLGERTLILALPTLTEDALLLENPNITDVMVVQP